MYLTRKVLLALLSTSLTACAQWPDTGYGGFSETRIEHLISTEADQPLSSEHGLRYDYSQLKNHLDILVLQGASVCFPAIVHQTELRENRIGRELRGGLYGDAASDILIQRYHLARLERQLNIVLEEEQCELDGESDLTSFVAKSDQRVEPESSLSKKYLLNLLNSDNQFATASAVVNPKYTNRLRSAAMQLRDLTHWDIHLTGHADARGQSTSNQLLSQKRAESVASFLVSEGIDSERIKIFSIGSDEALYQGSGAETLLVNRAVVIQLESRK